MSDAEFARRVAVQVQQQRVQMEQTGADVLLQNLMVADSDLKRVLKGEIQEPLDMLRDLIIDYAEFDKIKIKDASKILNILKTINKRISRFQRLVPYSMLLSHLMRLTNIDEKEMRYLKRKVSIMIRRDILDMDEEDLELTDVNFYDSLKIICWNAINDSLHGWKAKVVTEQKRIIEQEFKEPQKKGLLGRIF